eukprot:GHVL01024532.1.p1 GENE.GHVL01024532.1~~GHVL01024532.1.p1  ORF type:complete len:432 (-),score=56.02 GHVL01024532.1:36-1331(-)
MLIFTLFFCLAIEIANASPSEQPEITTLQEHLFQSNYAKRTADLTDASTQEKWRIAGAHHGPTDKCWSEKNILKLNENAEDDPIKACFYWNSSLITEHVDVNDPTHVEALSYASFANCARKNLQLNQMLNYNNKPTLAESVISAIFLLTDRNGDMYVDDEETDTYKEFREIDQDSNNRISIKEWLNIAQKYPLDQEEVIMLFSAVAFTDGNQINFFEFLMFSNFLMHKTSFGMIRGRSKEHFEEIAKGIIENIETVLEAWPRSAPITDRPLETWKQRELINNFPLRQWLDVHQEINSHNSWTFKDFCDHHLQNLKMILNQETKTHKLIVEEEGERREIFNSYGPMARHFVSTMTGSDGEDMEELLRIRMTEGRKTQLGDPSFKKHHFNDYGFKMPRQIDTTNAYNLAFFNDHLNPGNPTKDIGELFNRRRQ